MPPGNSRAGLVCQPSAWQGYVRDAVRDTPVRLVFTADEHDLQTRDDPRVL